MLSLASDNTSEGTAAIIRSALGAVESLVLAQDFSSWKSNNERSVQAVFTTYLLGSGMDHRPKVRKRALEAIEKILTNPPAHPSATHPAGDDAAAICFHTVQAQFSQSKKNKILEERNAKQVHSLQLLKIVASAIQWPKSSMRDLVELLLRLSSESYDNIVRLAALEVFQVIFSQASEDMKTERLREILDVFPFLTCFNDRSYYRTSHRKPTINSCPAGLL